jgi:hypothetical protein
MSRINDELIRMFMDGFFGYGNLKAPYWFIGMEEGGGNALAEVNQRLEVWAQRGRKQTDDLVEFHKAIGVTSYFAPVKPPLQKTWKQLIRVLHGLENHPLTDEAIRQTQRSAFGRSSGTSCLLELLPLPSPSTGHWLYGDYSHLPELKSRETYRASLAPQRSEMLHNLIAQHQPRIVLFYGLQYMKYWQDVAGIEFQLEQFAGFSTAFVQIKHTHFVATPHPTSFGVTNAYFDALAQHLRV